MFTNSSVLAMSYEAPFEGVRVLDLSQGIAGPYAGMPPSGSYATADGWMYIVTHRDADFGKLCEALELAGVKDDDRFKTNALRSQHLTALTEALNAAFARCTTEQLAKRLRDAGIMHSPVNDYLDFLRQPQLEATGLIAWLDQPGVGQVPVPSVPGLPAPISGSARAKAPSLDEHRAEILAELG